MDNFNNRKPIPDKYYKDSTLILENASGDKSSISFFVSGNIPYVIVNGELLMISKEVIRCCMTNEAISKKVDKFKSDRRRLNK